MVTSHQTAGLASGSASGLQPEAAARLVAALPALSALTPEQLDAALRAIEAVARTTAKPPPARVAQTSTSALPSLQPLPQRAGHLPMAEVIDLYMERYAGQDTSRVQRLSWWRERIGAIALQDLSDDHVHAALQELEQQSSRYFAGKDAEGRPIYKAKKKPIAPGTVNRYHATLGAVVTWSIKQRVAPKGYVHPCRTVQRRPENPGCTRYLSAGERERLLDACRASSWPQLYLLVLLALTTGARKGELLGLRWADVDLERNEAHCGRTKNGDPRTLPLVPAVVDLLRAAQGKPTALVFASSRHPDRAFTFEPHFAAALHRARIGGFRFHDLRHSAGTMLAAAGATTLEIAEVLGHRQLNTTKRYVHLNVQHKTALIDRVMGSIR